MTLIDDIAKNLDVPTAELQADYPKPGFSGCAERIKLYREDYRKFRAWLGFPQATPIPWEAIDPLREVTER